MTTKPTTVRDKAYRRSFKDKPCIVCGLPGDETGEVVGHHLAHEKWRDDHLIALCGRHHQGHPESVHAAPVEAAWWAEYAPDLVLSALDCVELGESDRAAMAWAEHFPETVMDALKQWAEKEYSDG